MNIPRPPSKQTIPPHAKRVFKGIIFDVYQWQQEMFDGTKATFEKLKRRDTAIIIPVTPEGQIIVVEEEQPNKAPFTCFPGGRIEEGEDILIAAKRELLEETGHTSEDLKLWEAVQPVGKIEWVVYTFIARNCHKIADLSLDSGEKINLKFISFEELMDLVLSGHFEDMEMYIEFLKAKHDPQKLAELRRLFLDE